MFSALNIYYQIIFLLKAIVVVPVCIFYRTKYNQDDLWLIGENTGKCLGDNGLIFYQYCRERHPDKHIYFIISKKSSYTRILNGDKNILFYGSFRHIIKYLLATTCIYSHAHSDIAYKQIFKIFKGRGTRKVFLQHGVIGLKKIDHVYSRNNNEMDLFILSSEFEKEIVKNNFDINERVLKVTGLARYDDYYDVEKPVGNKILYMPTWREDVSDKLIFEKYMKTIESLLNNSSLIRLLKKNDVTFSFYVHERMEKYLDRVNSPENICKVYPGETSIHDLIISHSLLITDYSSVAWDFYYLGKPVIFYQFDQDDYIRDQGTYLDLNKELFGEVFVSEADVVNSIDRYLNSDLCELHQYTQKRNSYFSYRDDKNCQRIYDAIKSS